MWLIAGKAEGFEIATRDGKIGKVDDFYFDTVDWTVRYVVVDTGGWLTGRKVLIPTGSVESVSLDDKEMRLSLFKNQVEDSPGVETQPTVSRRAELELHTYYGWPPYWMGGVGMGAAGVGTPPVIPVTATPAPKAPHITTTGDQEETGVRSTQEVTGYGIDAADGDIGHVEDFLIETVSWEIGYVVVDTRNWLPGGRKVVLSPTWISAVNWVDRSVVVDLTREDIKQSPEFDPSGPFTDEFAERLHAHYDRPRGRRR